MTPGSERDSAFYCGGIPLLVASPVQEDHDALRDICRRWKWTTYAAGDCPSALRLVRQHQIPVVLCDRNLPGGGWKEILRSLLQMPHRPRLIVTSRLADHRLWIDVLELGAHDLLMTPFDEDEVARVVFLAWHAVQHARLRELAIPAAVA